MAKKVLSFIEDLYNEFEFIYPYYRVQEAGYDVDVVASEPKEFIGEHGLESVKSNLSYDEIDVDDYEGLLIPGGYSPDKVRKHEEALDIVREFNKQGKPIGMICHAPWVGVSAGIVDGKTLTSTASIKDDLENAGVKWVDEAPVVDGNIVTARSPEDLPKYAKAFLDLLEK